MEAVGAVIATLAVVGGSAEDAGRVIHSGILLISYELLLDMH